MAGKAHHYVINIKGKCSCGKRKHSKKFLVEHAIAKGHKIVSLPRKSGGHTGGLVY